MKQPSFLYTIAYECEQYQQVINDRYSDLETYS
jgi:hypothetical protein